LVFECCTGSLESFDSAPREHPERLTEGQE
jgi:hypothetical protein